VAVTAGAVTATAFSMRAGGAGTNLGPARNDGDGAWSVALAPSLLEQPDQLAIDWSFPADGDTWQLTTLVDVAGGVLFDLAAARSHDKLAALPVHEIERARTEAEQQLEQRAGFAFVPRLAAVSAPGDGDTAVLPLVDVREFVGTRIGLNTVQAPTVTVSRAGVAYGLGALPAGHRRVLVVEHGLAEPPGGAEHAALLLAADIATGRRDPRLIRRGNDDGEFEVLYAHDAAAGAFPIPEVEAFAQRVARTRLA
jgi:hypothetical protein